VAFVPLAAEASAHYPESPARVEATCEALVADRARFAQTAVGWTLRELARSEPERVEAFVERYLGSLSL
jgi:3-methyladenine DNA glycosylase AlkD